ncbi:MAG: type II toxin-antitoxin system RelE/ParE family toxin [Verrucomicrobia bacterium]|jgi:phage-related protein|nr:type II toxin-antitoxin system RelE/ParE family toxin [Verrucomicrobiota bacterium]|tara:strand:+ start:4929 stop:5285 length:357 start_codon:yes stop_codon:yes gene_type:complete
MATPSPRPLRIRFFKTEAGNEPVREWLLKLPIGEKKSIGADILTVQWAWPLGKPLVDSLGRGLWEVRSSLGNRIARVFFIMVDEEIILLHGIIKKSQKAPRQELDLARKRQSTYLRTN